MRPMSIAPLALALLSSTTAWAWSIHLRQPSAPDLHLHSTKLAEPERRFIDGVRERNLVSTSMSAFVAAQTTDDEVRSFAMALHKAGTELESDLRTVLASNGIEDPAPTAERARFEALNGPGLERKYLRAITEARRRDVEEFRKVLLDAKDASLRQWVEATLPLLRVHLVEAERLAQQKDVGHGSL